MGVGKVLEHVLLLYKGLVSIVYLGDLEHFVWEGCPNLGRGGSNSA